MRGIKLFIILGFVVAGLGPATAQEIYIKRNAIESKGENAKPSLYIKKDFSRNDYGRKRGVSSTRKPFTDFTLGVKRTSFRNDKLVIAERERSLEKLVEVYAMWERSGRKPKTAEERYSFQRAKTATRQYLDIPRSKALVAHLEMEQRKFDIRKAQIRQERRDAYDRQVDRIASDYSKKRRPYDSYSGVDKEMQADESVQNEARTETKTVEKEVQPDITTRVGARQTNVIKRTQFERPDIFVRPKSERKSGVFTGY